MTEEKRDPEKSAIEEPNALLHAIINSPDSIVIFALDRAYRYSAFNDIHRQTMKRIWGADIELGKSMLDYLTDAEDREKAKRNFDRALAGERFTLREQYGEPPNRFYFEDIYNPVVNEDGDTIGLSLFLTDITDKVEAEVELSAYRSELEGLVNERTEELVAVVAELRREEAALQASEEKFRALIDEAPYSIELYDVEGNWLQGNRAWEALWGIKPEDVLGIFNIFEDEQLREKGVVPYFEQAVAGNTALVPDLEYDAIEAVGKGRTRWVSSTIYPLVMREERPQFIVIVHRDITSRKAAEEERRVLEEKMLHAQKLESMGVLAGGIAHDFNNILVGILGNADLALESLDRHAAAKPYLDEIHNSSRRAAELANQMLAYSGRGKFSLEPIDLDRLIEETVQMLRISISKNAVLRCRYAGGLPVLEGDPSQVRQIIMNLVINASDAIERTSGIITLSTGQMHCDRSYLEETNLLTHMNGKHEVTEGLYVFVEISDTGCGMSESTINKMFDPFFTTKFTGRGLGLAAVLGIVRGHGGLIRVYSEEGKGTTFKVLFPASERLGEHHESGATRLAGVREGKNSGLFLAADDEESARSVSKRMLERLGFSVLTAVDGREAVELFKVHQEEVVGVLLDLTMPHLDGGQVFREIRKIDPDVRVILTSGYSEQDATQEFVGKGLAGFIQKPFGFEELSKIVNSIFVEKEKSSE